MLIVLAKVILNCIIELSISFSSLHGISLKSSCQYILNTIADMKYKPSINIQIFDSNVQIFEKHLSNQINRIILKLGI